MKSIKILDTTIRDGELSPSFSPSLKSRLEIACNLERIGIDTIEIASTADSEERLNQSKSIVREIKRSTVCWLSQLTHSDLGTAKFLLDKAEKSRIHLYLNAKNVHEVDSDTGDSSEILDNLSKMIREAIGCFSEVQFSPQDATRVSLEALCEIVDTAVEAGARIINITDTVGTANPEIIRNIHSSLISSVPNIKNVELSLHAHNHKKNAIDNAITALNSGFTQIDGTINGVGPAGGNTDLVLLARKMGELGLQHHNSFTTNADLKELSSLSKMPAIAHAMSV